jgi:cysteine desulfuration protein SufE
VSSKLDEIAAEMGEADAEDRKEMLIDFVRSLPPLPERFSALKDPEHLVHECVSQVYLFVEVEGDRVSIFADAPLEAPTARGFVSLLIEGLNGATVAEVMAVGNDLITRLGLPDLLSPQRLRGVYSILRQLKSEVVKAAAGLPAGPAPAVG